MKLGCDERINRARSWIANSISSNRFAHAYLLAGEDELTIDLSLYILRSLFSDDPEDRSSAQARKIESRKHPDISWIEPESKSRIIRIDQVRDLIERMSQTSFYGGWKASVIVGADRFRQESANCFLKLLEEPPAKSLILLLSEHHEDLLPTIRSRCQLISLRQGARLRQAKWSTDLLEILRDSHAGGLLDVFAMSRSLQAILGAEKSRAEEEVELPEDGSGASAREVRDARISAHVLRLRHEILQWIIMWHRDVLMLVAGADEGVLHFKDDVEYLERQAQGLTIEAALAILDRFENMARRLERPIPEDLVFDNSLIEIASIGYKSRLESREIEKAWKQNR